MTKEKLLEIRNLERFTLHGGLNAGAVIPYDRPKPRQ